MALLSFINLRQKQMEIKRKFEISVSATRRFIIRQPASDKQIACATCGEPMLRIEQAAGLFDIKQRQIFQIIEKASVHFIEDKTSSAMICITSLAEVLDDEENLTPTKVVVEKRRRD